jgi:hypothetical protein
MADTPIMLLPVCAKLDTITASTGLQAVPR